jgi:hypothetical protein
MYPHFLYRETDQWLDTMNSRTPLRRGREGYVWVWLCALVGRAWGCPLRKYFQLNDLSDASRFLNRRTRTKLATVATDAAASLLPAVPPWPQAALFLSPVRVGFAAGSRPQ